MNELSEPMARAQTYTVDEAAELLGFSRTTAYECIHSTGEIPARRFGPRIVVLRHQLERLLLVDGAAGEARGVETYPQADGRDP